MNRSDLIKLLKSGNFMVASHDYGQVTIYKGRLRGYTYFDPETEEPEFPSKPEDEVISFELSDASGYMQDIVKVLTEALGGVCGGSA